MGNVIKEIDLSNHKRIVNEVNEYLEQEEKRTESITDSTSFKLVYYTKRYDELYLDPIVGFFIPGFGDLLSSVTILPSLCVALFKLHSIKLVIAILTTAAIDVLCGIVPIIGDIVDAFYKSNKIANRLIVGYIERDENIMQEINKRAIWGIIGMVVIGFLLYTCYSLIMSIYHWIVNIF